MCKEVRSELLTLSRTRNMQFPRQQASKPTPLLGRETSMTITTAENFPNV